MPDSTVVAVFTARCYAQRGIAMASRPSVRPPVCPLWYHGHKCWNISKIIPRLISLGYSHSLDPNITDLLQRNDSKFWPEYGLSMKKWLSVYKSS